MIKYSREDLNILTKIKNGIKNNTCRISDEEWCRERCPFNKKNHKEHEAQWCFTETKRWSTKHDDVIRKIRKSVFQCEKIKINIIR